MSIQEEAVLRLANIMAVISLASASRSIILFEGRRAIFRDDGDCTQFLACLAACVEAFGVRLNLFCLMPVTGHFKTSHSG